jgi:4-aminobutyrate aminotransferase-like enzyme/Ser/Thr protein kinase RdoA (MazF antagonist)
MADQQPTQTKIASDLQAQYGEHVSLQRAAGENENYIVTMASGRRFVLKMAGADTPRQRIELEHAAVEAAAGAQLGVALPRLVPNRSGDVILMLEDTAGVQQPARLLEFVAGSVWGGDVPAAPQRLHSLGRLVAGLAQALAGIDSPAARVTHHWDLAHADRLRAGVIDVADASRRRLLDRAFERFCASKQDLAGVPHGLTHGDLNDDNIMVSAGAISGVLDFGDGIHNPLVCDLAIALAYVLLDEPDTWAAAAQVVAGYHAVRPLCSTEIELLYPLICARLAVSLVTSARRRLIDSARAAWFVSEARAWAFMERHGNEDPVAVADRLAALIAERPYPDRGASAVSLRPRRAAHTSSALSLSFDEPVKFMRGRGAYLVDERGRPFLDLYNNVCHVGHCHPHVVQAGQQQMARLNTNTRYLSDVHLDYVERLAATLPAELGTIFLVNSGSEANELALRLARLHTGHQDVLVVENAYHGHTQALIDISPYKFEGRGGMGRPDFVHKVPVPDGLRGPHRGHHRATGERYGDDVAAVIRACARPPAAYIAETLQSCGGQIIPPPGYFETAFAHVRAAGGVCILDEVQVGFGRVGSHFWAFQVYGVVPDIVVMGKPIGNGHPMAAVACTRAVAASLEASGMEFFATFGGNPVSCAIGSAVLDVIETEGLQDKARLTGEHLLACLRNVQQRHACIADVRGLGMFAGIEMADADGAPDAKRAHKIVQALRERRILTGTDGPHHNVIKIKPPLVVGTADVDRFVGDLDAVLGAL